MIRDVVIHISNEQPLRADLFDLPAATDAGLVCTNLRMIDGKKPLFIDRLESTFFFPYRTVRFLEIAPGAIARHRAEADRGDPFDMDADHLSADDPAARLPAVILVEDGTGSVADHGGPDDGGPDEDLAIDEDFLQRIRDI